MTQVRSLALAALAAAVLTATPLPAPAQQGGTVLAALDEALASDPGFTPAQRGELQDALSRRFADYGLQPANAARREAVRAALSMIVEGSFDESPAERVADVAFAAYQAVARGAPSEVVEGIGLYGYRKKIAADRLSAWANGYQQMASAGVPSEVAADLIRATMEGDWDDSTFDTLKWSLVDAAKRRFDMRAYATYLLGHMQEPGRKAGALTGEAQGYFRRLAKNGEKPKLPAYEGVFTPRPPKPAAPPAEPKDKLAEADKTEAETYQHVPEHVDNPAPKPADGRAPGAIKSKTKTAPVAAAPAAAFDALWPRLYGTAQSYLGTPYVWGGVTHKGIDCSALTQNTYGENDVRIPRVSRDQWKTGSQVEERGWRRGDLVFFNTLGKGVSHVGMIVDPDGPKFIHASSSKGVMVADLSKNYFRTRYLGARRVVP